MAENTRARNKAPMVPTLHIAGLAPIALAVDVAELTLNKRDAAALGRDKVNVRSWSTLAERTREVEVWDDETDDVVTLALVQPRSFIVVDAPRTDKGAPVPVPDTFTLEAFGEKRDVAAAKFARTARKQKRDGKETGKLIAVPPVTYAQTTYGRPSGAVFGYVAKVTPSADGRKWRIGATLAQ